MNESIFKRIPVKDVTDEEDAEYERRVMEIQQMKRDGLQTEEKEHELDLMILAHYGIIDQELRNKILKDSWRIILSELWWTCKAIRIIWKTIRL